MHINSAGSAGINAYLQQLAAKGGKKRAGMGQGGGMEVGGADGGMDAGGMDFDQFQVNALPNNSKHGAGAGSGVNAALANGHAGNNGYFGNIGANQNAYNTPDAPAVPSVDGSSRAAGEDDRQSYTSRNSYAASADYLMGMLSKGSVYQNSDSITSAEASASPSGADAGASPGRSIFNEVLKSYSDAGRANQFNFSDLMQRNIAAAYGT